MKVLAGGGSLKILAARSPRNLRSHDAKVLLIDEADGMDVTVEGDPVLLAEKRTMAHPDRKIVVGSTPTIDGVSVIQRLYDESDQRIFEVPCPKCGAFKEILWPDIRWPEGEPAKAAFWCSSCNSMIDERHKPGMVADGEWRAMRPEVKDHVGFRINSTVSLFANANWGLLAQEFLKTKRSGPTEMQVFVNTVEGRVWKRSLDSLDKSALIARGENFSLERIPQEVLAISAGVDVQHDRLEVTICGWSRHTLYVLGHVVIWGSTLQDTTWAELDALLRRGGNTRTDGCSASMPRRSTAAALARGRRAARNRSIIFAHRGFRAGFMQSKGKGGPQRVWRPAAKKDGGVRLFIVGVDQIKTEIMERLAAEPFIDTAAVPCRDDQGCGRNPQAIRVSASLTDAWFEQVTAERRFIRYVRNRAVIEFRPIRSGIRNEGLDCLVYAMAARRGARIDFDERALRDGAVAREETKPHEPRKPSFLGGRRPGWL